MQVVDEHNRLLNESAVDVPGDEDEEEPWPLPGKVVRMCVDYGNLARFSRSRARSRCASHSVRASSRRACPGMSRSR